MDQDVLAAERRMATDLATGNASAWEDWLPNAKRLISAEVDRSGLPRWLRDDVVEDLVGDFWARRGQIFPQYRGESSFESFARGAIRHMIADKLRATLQLGQREELMDLDSLEQLGRVVDRVGMFSELSEGASLLLRLRKLSTALPPVQRHTLHLRLEGLSIGEIAKMRRVARSTVHEALVGAVCQLKRRVKVKSNARQEDSSMTLTLLRLEIVGNAMRLVRNPSEAPRTLS